MSKIAIKKSPEEFYKQFDDWKKPKYDTAFIYSNIDKLTRELMKIKVKVIFLKWNKDQASKFFLSEIMAEKVDEILEKEKTKLSGVIFFADKLVYQASYDGKLHIHHMLDKDIIKEFNKIFISIFPNRTLGFTFPQDTIVVHMTEQKQLQKAKEHVLVGVTIKFKDKTAIIESHDALKLALMIEKKYKKYIVYLKDRFSSKGELALFYEVYTDKVKAFGNLFKEISTKNFPEVKEIYIFIDEVPRTHIVTWKF